MPPSYIRVRALVWAYGRGQTDTQMRVTNIRQKTTTTDQQTGSNMPTAHGGCWKSDHSFSHKTTRKKRKLCTCANHTFNTITTATDCTLVQAHTCNIHTVSLQAHITVFTQAGPYKHKASIILSTSKNVTTFPSHKQCDDISSTIVNKL